MIRFFAVVAALGLIVSGCRGPQSKTTCQLTDDYELCTTRQCRDIMTGRFVDCDTLEYYR